uniref:fructose-bisphosphatase n=1 Tax=Odontella aurita TaxID=265563 RepID=A0A7S4I9V6_9STRA
MRDPRRRPGARSRRLPPTLGLSLSALLASSGFLPSSALSFAPPRSAASRSVRASSSILRVVPIRTGDPPPYRPRYRPQDNPVLPPHSARPGKIEDDEYYTADVPPSAARTSSSSSYSPLGFAAASSSSSAVPGQRVTLTRFLSDAMQDSPELRDIESLLLSVQMACKTISHLVDRAGINQLSGGAASSSSSVVGGGGAAGSGGATTTTTTTDTAALARAGSDDPYEQYDFRLNSMKRLDQLSTNVLRNALRFTGKLQMVAPARDGRRPLPGEEDSDDGGEDVAEVMMDDGPADHQPGVLIAKALDGRYVACFDPLDGSGNADAAICTGTVFGVFETPEEPEEEDDEDAEAEGDDGGDGDESDDEKKKKKKKEKKEKRGVGKDVEDAKLVRSVLQPGRSLRAAGYCLYSSATILVLTTGDGTHGFTLDPQINEFVLTHPNIRIPPRGNVYSCNEANSEGWDDDLRSYLRALKTGQGQTGTRYALRYVGSMVGDIHRTLMYGGLFCYPSDAAAHPRGNLQLLYKSAPMAFVVEQAGGKSSDGRGELLDVVPRRVHQRSPCFIGSPEDIEEMKTFIPHEEG